MLWCVHVQQCDVSLLDVGCASVIVTVCVCDREQEAVVAILRFPASFGWSSCVPRGSISGGENDFQLP